MSDKAAQEVNVFHDVKPVAKRTAKNSVFLDLFKDKKYLLELYRTLHPEDMDGQHFSLNTFVSCGELV